MPREFQVEHTDETRFGTPELCEIIAAVPHLHWRRCRSCGGEALHADTVTPWVKCRACGSQDTRPMHKANDLLQGKR